MVSLDTLEMIAQEKKKKSHQKLLSMLSILSKKPLNSNKHKQLIAGSFSEQRYTVLSMALVLIFFL